MEEIVVPYPLFRHLDFREVHPGPSQLFRCERCQSLWRDRGTATLAASETGWQSLEYATHEEFHTLVVDGHDKPVSRTFLQAELLARLIPADGDVLDIGCFDGALLRELSQRTAGDLVGYDVCEPARFPTGERFRHMTGHLRDIDRTFDLVVMSHAMQYIRDVQGLLVHIRRFLEPNGVLFVQVPDYSLKPCSLLLGDQHYHYTPVTVTNTFVSSGFACEALDNAWFGRDILMTCRPDAAATGRRMECDRRIYACRDQLAAMAERLTSLEPPSMAVLGTTIEAAFADSMLRDRVTCFVDENPRKIGTLFHERPVIHPQSVRHGDSVIIPMGKSADAIRDRLSARYPGEYIAV